MKNKTTFNTLFLLIILIAFTSCNSDSKVENIGNKVALCAPDSENIIRTAMNDSIDNLIAKTNYFVSIYENDKRVNLFRNQIKENSDVQTIFSFSRELLNSGRTDEAIKYIKNLFVKYPSLQKIDANSRILHEFLGICFLRKGEQENCITDHSDQSCIVPIKGKGFHRFKTGSELAIDKYLSILEIQPDDYQSMWLLNIAYMTLNRYPQDVPKKYLIKLNKFDDITPWKNIAKFTGLDHYGLSGSVILDDFNNDNLQDIIISSWGHSGVIKYFVNRGASGFEEMTHEANLINISGGLNMKQGDFNNDGFIDFLILRGPWRPNLDWGVLPNSLMRNNGDGTFTDITIQSNIYSVYPSQSAEWIDFDNDGLLDLFIANETTSSSKGEFPCELYHNNGDETFTNIAKNVNANVVGYFKGVNMDDINNDGFMDIFISNLDGENVLLLNIEKDGKRSFKNIAKSANVTKPNAGFSCWFFDANNDGWPDIFVSSFDRTAFTNQSGQVAKEFLGMKATSESPSLYINNKNNTFSDLTNNYLKYNALASMGCNVGDVNNDGFKDFYLGTGAPDYRAIVPNRLFLNQKGKSFRDITFETGLGHIQKGHGIAFCDMDNDGDQDIYANMGGAFSGDKFPNAFFENPGNKNKWVKIKLVGVSSNKYAIGAKIKVIIQKINGQSESIYHKIGSGGSFGCNSLLANIGLGDAKLIKSISVKWPNGKNEFIDYSGFDTNAYYIIEENSKPVKKEIHSFRFAKGTSSHNHE